MRKITVPEGYHDRIYRLYGRGKSHLKSCRNITFVVTEDCCLKCTYCYEKHKTKKRMSFETGKQIIDYLFDMYEKNDPEAFINKDTVAVILDFIGGEPLLEIKLISDLCDYFWRKALMKQSPWAENFRISITTNGVMYFNPEVQDFIERFGGRLSMTVTIDGDKEMHDKCRIHHDGSGSWEEAYAAEKDLIKRCGYDEPGTKVTISPENLPYLYKTIDFFLNEGYVQIFANAIYEHKWSEKEAKNFYDQLIAIADRILAMDKPIYVSLFDENFFVAIDESENGTWCGGSGEMLAFDTEGLAYPCLRYMEMSLNGEQAPVIIGDCYRGIYQDECEKQTLKELLAVNRRSQCTDECYYCPIAKGCASCTAWDYQSSGKFACKSMNICETHKARCLANVYYWNKLYRMEEEKDGAPKKRFPLNLPKDDAIRIISEEEYEKLRKLTE